MYILSHLVLHGHRVPLLPPSELFWQRGPPSEESPKRGAHSAVAASAHRRRVPEAAAAAAALSRQPRSAVRHALLARLEGGVARLSLGPPDAHLVAECPVRHLPARATLTACTSAAPAHTAHRCQQHCPGNMSRVEAAAATRDYALKPRLEYRTVAGVNGPLVILEVRRCPCAQYFLAPVQKSGLRLGMLVVRAFAAADLLTAVPVAYRMCAGRDSPRS